MMQESGGSRSSQMPPQGQPHQPQQRTWERFCREEAREAASAFLERVRRFKSRHASARDVHDSTFTNEFSAAFLEESSVLMASEGATVLPTTSGPFTTSLPADVNRGVGNVRGGAGGNRGTSRRKASKPSSGKSSWWSNLFKWKSKNRERSSSGSSTSSISSPPAPSRLHGSTKQKKRRGITVVKETAVVQLLNLSNESEGAEDANWNACKLMLVEQQENYQLEIYSPPRNPMPKMSLFCFLIEEVRSTSLLEIPDSNSCFAVKSQSHGEYVFDVGAVEVKEEWVRLLQAYTRKTPATNGHLPRSSEPSSHLATLPRTPSRQSSPARRTHQGTSPSRGTSGGNLQASPLLTRRTCEQRPSNPAMMGVSVGGARSDGEAERVRHLSISDSRKVVSTNPAIVQGDSEESVLVDMSSFMRSYSQSRSPNRQRKTMSMFVDSSVQITNPPQVHVNPYVQATPPVNIVSPTSPSHERTEKPESPVRFPYGSPRSSPPPPVPKRGSRPHSMFIKNAVNTNAIPPPRFGVTSQQCHAQKALPARPDESALSRPLPLLPDSSEATSLPAAQAESRSLPTSPNEIAQPPATPTGSRPLPAIPNEAVPRQAMPRPLPAMPSEATPHPATPTGTRPHLHGETVFPSVRPKENSVLSSTPKLIPFSGSEEKKGERPLPKRKFSQPSLPSSPHIITSQDSSSTCEFQSLQGNLGVMEDCSQSSSALHPVSIAALARPRKNSIPLTPTEEGSGPSSLVGNGIRKLGKERKRKTSAPMLPQGFSVLGEVQEKKVNGMIDKRSESRSSVDVDLLEAGTEADEDVELERQIEAAVDSPAPKNEFLPQESLPPALVTCEDSEGEKSGNHAMLFFPYFSQRSSPSQHQAPPGTPPINSEPAAEEGGLDEEPPPLPPPLSADIVNSMSLSSDNQTANSSTTHTPPPNREEAVSRSSSHTNRSVHSISSLEDRDNNVRTESATSNPIFVETTESQGYNQATVHTRHPYEYWATNQQDVTNLRALSQFPWFHGMISRTNASQLVVAEGDRGTGQYLVRQSESREGDFVLTFNYHGRAKHLRMTVDDSGCNIQHLWFESVHSMLEYFRTNSIPLESFWLNDDVRLTSYINRQASDAFRTTTVVNVDQLNRVPPRRSRSLHLGMSHAVTNGSSHPTTPSGEQRGSSSASASTNSLQSNSTTASGWRQIFRSQRSSSAQNVGRIQRSHSHNAGSIQSTGRGGGGGVAAGGGNRSIGQHTNRENAYVWRNY